MAAASEPQKPDPTVPFEPCAGRTRAGGLCKLPAGHGTDHVGFGKCKLHAGSSPSGRIHAARLEALRLGAELQMEPHDALLLTVRRAAMWEAFCATKVAALKDDELAIVRQRTRDWSGVGENGNGAGSETITENVAELNLWLREHHRSLDQLARLAKCALDAGVQERQVRIAEQFGDVFGTAIRAIFDELGLTAVQQQLAPAVVRRHLLALEGGRAA